jgi:hypothetical protein
MKIHRCERTWREHTMTICGGSIWKPMTEVRAQIQVWFDAQPDMPLTALQQRLGHLWQPLQQLVMCLKRRHLTNKNAMRKQTGSYPQSILKRPA